MENPVIRFIKDWTLPLAMATGAGLYLLYRALPALSPAGPALHHIAVRLQPLLIFLMLFLQFSKISPRDLHFRPWNIALLVLQGGFFLALAALALQLPEGLPRILAEAAMLCLVCPTAIAAGVITDKIGGSLPAIMTYLALINCLVSLLIPAVLPMLHPMDGLSFVQGTLLLLRRVFSSLILPTLLAWLVRWRMPRMQRFLEAHVGWAFYIWSLSLTILMVLTTRILVISRLGLGSLALLGLVSLACCVGQFALGRWIGRRGGRTDSITAGQAFGQKNTSLMIWIGYSYMTQETAIAGGLYCIWHNLVNSWELYRERQRRPDR